MVNQKGKLSGQAAIELRSGATAGRLTGQAAMEYLMTYGWALLAVVIVVGVLVAINPLSAPPTCRFDHPGFGCPSIPSISQNGNLFMRVTNLNNNEVKVLQVLCIDDKSSAPPNWPASAPLNYALERQDEVRISPGPDGDISANCTRTTGEATFAPGEEFTGRVWIKYVNSEDPSSYPNRTISATISTKVA